MVIGSYDPIIAQASRRFGVPEERIRAVMSVESGGRRDAVSPKGAAGLMQIMAPTYQDLAKRHGFGPDRFDPTNNIMAGTAYLGEMYNQFGNWGEATLAYNMGPGRATQVRNGAAAMPAETAAYGPKVNAVLASFGQGKGADVPLFGSNRAATEDESVGWMNSAMSPMGDPRLANLLDYMPSQNHLDGLGLLGNAGQTPSQPPRTDPAALPTQTDRLDLSGRINELIGQYTKQPPTQMPSQLQYMLAGAQKGMQGLTGTHDRPVGIGEILGALGGGVTSGGLAYDEAASTRRESELDRLLKAGAYQNQTRTAALNEANSIIDNRYKEAQTLKALKPESDAERYKVVGKHVYDTRTQQFIASPEAGGLFEGTAADVQGVNALIKAGKMTPEQGALWLSSKTATGPNGQVDVINPLSIPGAVGAPAPSPTAPNAATQAPAPGASPPPAVNPGVTTVRPPEALPQGEATKLRGQIDTLNKLKGAVSTLGNHVEKAGMQIGAVGALGGAQGAMYEDLQTQLRLANELGVLNGPDERKLLEQISNPTALSTYIRGLGGPSYFNAQMKVLQDKINREIGQYEERLGIKKPDGGGSGGGAPTTVLKLDGQGNIIR